MLWIFRSTSTFQSTPSAWRETFLALHSLMLAAKFQSTPSAWRETPPVWQILLPVSISIHSLRMEGDEAAMCQLAHRNYFNPLPPHGGRPYCTYQPAWLSRHFNPLPPHGGRRGEVMYSIKRGTFQSTPSAWRETYRYLAISCSFGNFNPLPPHGGRLRQCWLSITGELFQSTPSAWRETLYIL